MSYTDLRALLEQIFSRLNSVNGVPNPDEVWSEYAQNIYSLLDYDDFRNKFFISLGNSIELPKALEAARILHNLRQRFAPNEDGNRLVGRIRAEVVQKERPTQEQLRNRLEGVRRSIANVAPTRYDKFSSFQVEGWMRVMETIQNRNGMVIVAPTGSGKTEVFLMPVVYMIAHALSQNQQHIPRFVMLYPRVTLLKDQLARIFRYVYYAEQQYLSLGGTLFGSSQVSQGIVIGFQFGGIFSSADYTLDNREIFTEDRIFRTVEQCPICQDEHKRDLNSRSRIGFLRAAPRSQGGIRLIQCDNTVECGAQFRTSISKKDHATTCPHLLVTTAESLDILYLNPRPEFENYLRQLTGIVFDEVHLYYSLYGVHIHNLIRRLEELQNGQRLAKIAASATVSSPERFAAKLFYGNENHSVEVHSASNYPQDPAGLEILYFLQSPEEDNSPGAAPTLIQSLMAIGHGVLNGDDRALVFTESLDMAGRLQAQSRNAETERWNNSGQGQGRGLWEFRTIANTISFQNQNCPRTSPNACNIYLQGECWRGFLGGQGCFQAINSLRERNLSILQVSSKQRNDYWDGDIVVATSALEVGVDDERIKATIHYLPPRTVFSFIQRRGRAGRSVGETAYTVMILGTSPSDHFYFFRRNRLVHGTYELPLNPQNPIVRAMHDLLRDERQRMSQHIQQSGNSPQGIWRWIWETLNRCQIIRRYYGEQLAELNRSSRNNEEQTVIRGILGRWIDQKKASLEKYLSLRWLLREIQEELPLSQELRHRIEAVTNAVNGFLSNQGISREQVDQELVALYDALSPLRHPNLDPEARLRLRPLRDKVEEVWEALQQQALGIELHHAEGLYDFFDTLKRLCSPPRVLNTVPDVLKIVLQAMFYLHLGLDDTDEPGGCLSRVDYFIPDAYFQTVQPVVMAVRYRAETGRTPDLYPESVTDLATTFIPYKPVYRYEPHSFLFVLDTEHNPAWVSEDRRTVRIRLKEPEGVRRGDALQPKKVYLRPLGSDETGDQIVKFCPQCYAIYNNRRQQCRCNHNNLLTVKLYAEPIVEREYEAIVPSRAIIASLRFLEQMRGTTTIHGSSVEARRWRYDPQERRYRPLERGQNQQFAFEARYEIPIRYSIPTKGISWNLTDVVERLVQDGHLSQQVEQIVIAGERKSLDEALILHTAAHLLHRAIAAISGVNEQVLEYWYNPDAREVVVWERYEGGAGISEIIVDALRTNPVDFYRELLASVLCPVDLAERPDWTAPEQLRIELADRWYLSRHDELIVGVVQEAEAERYVQIQQQNEENRLVCRANDGCPACIHTTYCTERDEQVLRVSRLVGEAILGCFVQRLSREDYEAAIAQAITLGIEPPHTLFADPEQGVFDVLLL